MADDHKLGVNVLVFVAESESVSPHWDDVSGEHVLSYTPARLVDDYEANVVPQVGEYIMSGSPAVPDGFTQVRVAAVVHHWSEQVGAMAYVLTRPVDPAAPLRL
ncbi:hypothetical protein [Lentzea sp. NPDC055074]